MDQRPWYVEFFDDDYLRLFGPVLPAERTVAEVNGVVELLGLPPGARLLDLCCGHGRHAVPLAELGYRVTGLDRSHGFLARAAALAAGRGQAVGLVAGDMRRLPFGDGRFDAVVNLFNAFGYLEDDAEDERVLAEVARVLKPGGSFLQELANREAVVRGWHDSDVLRLADGLVVLQERTLDLRASRDRVRYTLLHPDGRRTTRDHVVRLYTLTELEAMLGRAGAAGGQRRPRRRPAGARLGVPGDPERACGQGIQLNSVNHSFVAHRGPRLASNVGCIAGG